MDFFALCREFRAACALVPPATDCLPCDVKVRIAVLQHATLRSRVLNRPTIMAFLGRHTYVQRHREIFCGLGGTQLRALCHNIRCVHRQLPLVMSRVYEHCAGTHEAVLVSLRTVAEEHHLEECDTDLHRCGAVLVIVQQDERFKVTLTERLWHVCRYPLSRFDLRYACLHVAAHAHKTFPTFDTISTVNAVGRRRTLWHLSQSFCSVYIDADASRFDGVCR